MYERHLAYSNPRPAPSLGPDERYVVLRFTPDRPGDPDGPGKYEVLVEDEGRNVIGWQYPMTFAKEEDARAEANKIWVHLRKVNAEYLVRRQASQEREAARQKAIIALWSELTATVPGWKDLPWGERRAEVERRVGEQMAAAR